ncbi:MAG: NAD(P)-dependent oxidoreductase [Planctomycetota bacterium]|nr:NAD(P)-dependent oxidoreductase [Planctomycetota bacterium]
MEKILVTGGAGYIGSVLTPMLLDAGHRVTIYDNIMYGAQPLLSFCGHRNLELVKGDVREADAVAKAVKGHDWIVHLAAIVGYPACAADPLRANSVNVEGTRNIVKSMGKGQRLIFASTGSTYGKVEGTATEETPIAPLTLYGRNKRDCEELIKGSIQDFILLRFATVFGSSPRLRLDLLVNDFVYQAIHNRQIILYEGHFRRTFLHSQDAAAVYPFCMQHYEQMRGQTYNVGDETMNYTKKEIAQMIKKYVEYYLHEAEVGHDMDQRDYAVDYSKLRTLGYRAKVSMDDGIQELVKIFRVLRTSDPLRNV